MNPPVVCVSAHPTVCCLRWCRCVLLTAPGCVGVCVSHREWINISHRSRSCSTSCFSCMHLFCCESHHLLSFSLRRSHGSLWAGLAPFVLLSQHEKRNTQLIFVWFLGFAWLSNKQASEKNSRGWDTISCSKASSLRKMMQSHKPNKTVVIVVFVLTWWIWD